MEFNYTNCKVLKIAGIKKLFNRDYFLGGKKLERVFVEKYLGVLVTHNLSWNSPVDCITSKAHRKLNLLYRTCNNICDISVKRELFITWVRSRLEYASPVWSPHTKRNITALEQVQRKARVTMNAL